MVGGRKITRLAALAGQARLAVCVDDGRNVAELSAAAVAAGVTLGVLVEIEVGCERCGVAPGEPARVLAAQVAESPGLEFGGLQAYHGNAQHIRTIDERRAAVRRAADLAAETAELLGRAGLSCAVVSGGGTGTLPFDLEAGVLTELQAGSYIFLDADYAGRRWHVTRSFVCPDAGVKFPVDPVEAIQDVSVVLHPFEAVKRVS